MALKNFTLIPALVSYFFTPKQEQFNNFEL